MIDYSVILNGRQEGKTSAIMGEIHDLIVAGRHGEILVVFPDSQSVHWWVRLWQEDFPFVPMVDYTVISNLLKIRGRQYGKIYVEDVDRYPDGIWDQRIIDLQVGTLRDAEIIFTSSRFELNQRSHNAVIKPAEVLARTRKRLWRKH